MLLNSLVIKKCILIDCDEREGVNDDEWTPETSKNIFDHYHNLLNKILINNSN